LLQAPHSCPYWAKGIGSEYQDESQPQGTDEQGGSTLSDTVYQHSRKLLHLLVMVIYYLLSLNKETNLTFHRRVAIKAETTEVTANSQH
jgi:hypothetical protein